MDELRDFFNLSKEPAKVVQLQGSQTGGVLKVDKEDLEELIGPDRTPYAPSASGTDYAALYKEQEMSKILEHLSIPVEEEVKTKEMLDDLTSLGDVNRISELVDDTLFYKKYVLNHNKKQKFTINSKKQEILQTIQGHSVTIIDGPTGCGKTTQVPQWILEEHYERRQLCNIIVTQPRRIAAISIAKRVCEENNFELGGIVGYQVGLDSKISNDTRLHYVTTGVLLQKLVSSRSMERYTHVILDEVHERNQEMDFLFIVVKKLLLTNRVKVILMSATFDVEKFSSYFSLPTPHGFEKHPVIKIDSQRMFNISIYYLQVLSCLGQLPEIKYNEPKISQDMFLFTMKLLNAFESIDSVEEEDAEEQCGNARPSVLIFLPGIHEIEELFNTLSDQKLRKEINPKYSSCKWLLIPLHSTITVEEQVRVFRPSPPEFRKIILATNIAESSITVPDIKYVIDFCLTKVLMSNSETNFSSLQMTWASQANCKQRAGRAGRVREGRVYRMVHQDFFSCLPQDCVPEMQRCPLDNLVLHSKILNMGSPVSILALAMNPPDLSNISRTILNLKQVGALLKTVGGEMSVEDGDITYLGKIMAKLPLDIKISKLIVLGYIFGCLDDCIIMGAAMSVKNIFSTPFLERMMAYNSKLTWADGSTSDCIAFLNVYKIYQHLHRQNFFATARSGERGWAKPLFLQINALHELDSLVKEIRHRLKSESIVEQSRKNVLWNSIELPLILKLLIAGAFYPFYFTFSRSNESDEREATKVLCGRDPRNTVYLNNMDSRQPGLLYASSVREAIENHISDEMVISFDQNSSKVFITFPNKETCSQKKNAKKSVVPGKVSLPVYKAVKMKQLKIPITIKVMPVEKSMELASQYGICQAKGNNEWALVTPEDPLEKVFYPRLPDIDENYIDVIISHMVDCGHFWCQYNDSTTQQQMRWLTNLMNSKKILTPMGEVRPRMLCAAPFQENENQPSAYFRARVEKILPNNLIWVFYIDYGNNAMVPFNSLREFGSYTDAVHNISAVAFECALTEVAPSVVRDQRALWTNAATNRFIELTRGIKLLGKIFSVSLGVVSLELFHNNVSINKLLIEEGHAQVAEESYVSKLNRDLRNTAKELQPNQKLAINRQQHREFNSVSCTAPELPVPPAQECNRQIYLKGPHSPLETKVHNLMYAGRDKVVNIEWNSVNSVILNTDPQDPWERLLVSAQVDQSTSGGNLTLRHTTLMPNIPGLPAIVALAFCPTAELKPDFNQQHYAGALCGLGHYNGQPLFPEHDMLVPIDVHLSNEDLQNINKLRYYMDLMLLTNDEQDSPINSEAVKEETMLKIKEIVYCIISTPRKYREAGSVSKGWVWNVRYPDIEAEAINHHGDRAIFPQHNGLLLKKINPEELMKLAIINKKLYSMCESVLLTGNQKVECTICGTEALTLTGLRMHLYSRMHKEREEDLPKIDDQDDDYQAPHTSNYHMY